MILVKKWGKVIRFNCKDFFYYPKSPKNDYLCNEF